MACYLDALLVRQADVALVLDAGWHSHVQQPDLLLGDLERNVLGDASRRRSVLVPCSVLVQKATYIDEALPGLAVVVPVLHVPGHPDLHVLILLFCNCDQGR